MPVLNRDLALSQLDIFFKADLTRYETLEIYHLLLTSIDIEI